MGAPSISVPSVAVPAAFAGGIYPGNAGNNAGSLLGNGTGSGSYGYRNYTPDPKTEPHEVDMLARIIFAEAGLGSGGQGAVGWTVRNRVDADAGKFRIPQGAQPFSEHIKASKSLKAFRNMGATSSGRANES
ncbi:MAG: hypothetical protein ACP5SH_19255 [Syntrophobacteraceae bacterium]